MTLDNTQELSWDEYVNAPSSQAILDNCRMACGPALKQQRGMIERLIDELRSERAVFLGAGYLNDIPVERLFERGRKTYLVDWIPDVCEEGLRGSIICERDESYRCLFCSDDDPHRYCQGFRNSGANSGASVDDLCEAFCLVHDPLICCKNYVPGEEPEFVRLDITAGKAQRFAQRAAALIRSCHSPEQAFRRAIQECRDGAHFRQELPVASNSIDFVSSSMVVSQFDSEPYRYFSILLERHFERKLILRREKHLLPLMELLRAELFRYQMEGHVHEMYRIVNKDRGRVYFSVELFRSLPEDDAFFLAHNMPSALDILSRYFSFDFQTIPVEHTLQNTAMGDGVSIVQCYLLKPKRDESL